IVERHWSITKADLRPGGMVAVVASAREAARLSSDLLRLAKTAKSRGCAVRLYILDLDLAVAIPDGDVVEVRRFWVDAAPSAGVRAGFRGISIPSGLAEGPYPLPSGGWATGYYKDGQPTLVVTRHLSGTRLERLDSSGQSVQWD